MNTPQIAAGSMCPMCGAILPALPPGATQIACRFCQNMITISRGARPANLEPNVPSRTLYIASPGAGRQAAIVVSCIIGFAVLLPLSILAGPSVFHGIKNAVHPFPTSCDANDETSSSGNWEGTTPIFEQVGANCKIHIKNAKLKGSALFTDAPMNLELWLDNVTIETTDVMMKPGANLKLHVTNSTLTSPKLIIDQEDNITAADLTGSTLESQGATAIKAKSNLKLKLDHANIRGKKIAIDADTNLELDLKNASEVTSADGVAIKAKDNLHITSEGGKIDGGGGAIVAKGSNLDISGSNLTVNSTKDKAIATDFNLHVELADSTITAAADDAIDADSNPDLTFANTTVAGAHWAIKSTSNLKLALQQGTKVIGKQGAVSTTVSFKLTGKSSTIDGGSGPGLLFGDGGQIAFTQSTLNGNPAMSYEYTIDAIDVTGTTITGAQISRMASRIRH